ncbi:hypothetical protein HpBT171_09960 [Helicobacter pylori]
MKTKKRLIYSKWAFNFLSDWVKTKGFDVLRYSGRIKTAIRKESHKKQKIVSCKKSIERKLLV